ncbi:MAG: type II toxin-antitoxin system VapC family toxin [Propylenella sp.]
MIVDASALLAILFEEPEEDRFLELIQEDKSPAISPVNLVEAGIKADDPRHPAKGRALDALISAMNIEVAAITAEQARIAREAYQRYGKGRHPARLNLGDCFAYALATVREEPLLFKGNDFTQTDVEAAI